MSRANGANGGAQRAGAPEKRSGFFRGAVFYVTIWAISCIEGKAPLSSPQRRQFRESDNEPFIRSWYEGLPGVYATEHGAVVLAFALTEPWWSSG